YASLEGKYYCKPHFKQLFKTKGNYASGFSVETPEERWKKRSGVSSTPVATETNTVLKKTVSEELEELRQRAEDKKRAAAPDTRPAAAFDKEEQTALLGFLNATLEEDKDPNLQAKLRCP